MNEFSVGVDATKVMKEIIVNSPNKAVFGVSYTNHFNYIAKTSKEDLK